jgi:protein-S-isoprenylcysteine O-methyltransferase Ste14
LFLKGLLCGLLATGGNFALLYWATRTMLRKQSRATQILIPLTYLVRYLVLGGIVFLFLRFRLGSIWGLLCGVTIGVAGFLIWQVIDARTRHSDTLPS